MTSVDGLGYHGHLFLESGRGKAQQDKNLVLFVLFERVGGFLNI